MENNNNSELIIKLIKEGYLIKEIIAKTGISDSEIKKILKTLKQINPKLYDEIEAQKQANLVNFRSRKASEENRVNHKSPEAFFKDMVDIILRRHLSYEEALKFTNLSAPDFQNKLDLVIDSELRNKLVALFERRKKYPNLIVNNYSFNKQQEIIQLALTYRVSPESLADLLATSIDDIELLFANQTGKINEALQYLQWETDNEPQKNKLLAYEKAQDYLNRRKEICSRINEAKKNKQEKEVIKLTLLLKQLFHEIDDSIIINACKDVSKLTPQEKDKIGRYRLKYALHIRTHQKTGVINELNMYSDKFKALENEVKEKDAIFASKIEQLDAVFDNQKLKMLIERNNITSRKRGY